MNVSFNGFGETLATLAATGASRAGQPVKISANGTVAACAKGDVLVRRGGQRARRLCRRTAGRLRLAAIYGQPRSRLPGEIVMSDASTVTVPATAARAGNA